MTQSFAVKGYFSGLNNPRAFTHFAQPFSGKDFPANLIINLYAFQSPQIQWAPGFLSYGPVGQARSELTYKHYSIRVSPQFVSRARYSASTDLPRHEICWGKAPPRIDVSLSLSSSRGYDASRGAPIRVGAGGWPKPSNSCSGTKRSATVTWSNSVGPGVFAVPGAAGRRLGSCGATFSDAGAATIRCPSRRGPFFTVAGVLSWCGSGPCGTSPTNDLA